MAKRLSFKEKNEIVIGFTQGKSIDQLSIEFECTKSTVSRNLKVSLGDEKYKKIIFQNKKNDHFSNGKEKKNVSKKNNNNTTVKNNELSTEHIEKEELIQFTPFTEIIPLNYEIENARQKDYASIPISDIDFPKIVYMIVDKNIELEIKYLKDYPDWKFLSEDELSRKTIEIYNDLKLAKRFCKKEQKVIKVPNTDVFRIVAPLLLSRGISRIVNADNLIAL